MRNFSIISASDAIQKTGFDLKSITKEQYCFYGLTICYGIIGLVALIQLIRIQLRVPEYGWTTQKVFHLLNFLCSGVRAVVFGLRGKVDGLSPPVLQTVLLDSPGLLFFSTYTLLVLFWAEIYHQARSLPTNALRPCFVVVNFLVYTVQVALWVFEGLSKKEGIEHILFISSACFMAVVSSTAAAGFALYGGRLFIMLRRFPVQSPGRRKKLEEVGCVTSVCASCFTIRAVLVAYSAFHHGSKLDVMNHPLLNLGYYLAVEVIPSALVLFILRKLPPKRTQGYHNIS
mmetsp:Transcript_36095/g.43541  ORF Transcript_36095/g.43541 Transcript_36095/m.43541 type:complete len:287 (+) Transcript_36095:258-1118(+)|eukprot:CAMPEP_0197855164 /NCGR_PEP_ID=MMETSP1438-20131217/26108_1 /TAXON_ID=1461541 /ORGANISM="Pterosperma sp., Strain CCMP1384" /LENGTH=286 /DNA_ID=CAMNT_0043470169 /DNA_START=253 /DNA_END=1113 /DNA_ORIENTATION=+